MSDRSARPMRNLTIEDRIDVARNLQLFMIDQIGHVMKDRKDMIFHGGTALSLLHNSPRWSEDLDFMASPEAAAHLFGKKNRMEAAMKMATSVTRPGTDVDLKIKGDPENFKNGDVARMMLRWEDPALFGAIKVKVEFYICAPERIAEYQARMMAASTPEASAGMKINGAVSASIWGDKIVALAQRPALKFRDVHDLGLISGQSTNEERKAALSASMGIYGREPAEIAAGLSRDDVLSAPERYDDFIQDMRRWFRPELFEKLRGENHFRTCFDNFVTEFEIGRSMIRDMADEPVCQP